MHETMIDNQAIDTSTNVSPNVNNYADGYNYCKPDTEQKFYTNWSPQGESRYISKRRFTSPRILSKSVPRRTKTLMRYKINRSLNFDINHHDGDVTKSSSSSSESICSNDDRKLSRSAKIMRALNFNYNALHNQTKKIKKSLNFDLSPSPKRAVSKSPRDISNLNIGTPSPKLNRTSNYDTSMSNSTPNSALLTSSESIDENQNQTPSQRSRSAKKCLNYLTPNVKKNMRSPDQILTSPMLRAGLKQKIDNIIQISATPNLHSLRKSKKKTPALSNVTVSTPRNLFHDFSDGDGNRSSTPENMIRLIPESMSAIKKSHRKERLSRQIEHLDVPHTRIFPEKMDSFTDESIDSLHEEKRSSTPPMTDKHRSPTYDVNSIKQSHKKDKTKKKLLMPTSEDELSDTGSIFDYQMDQDEVDGKKKGNNSDSIKEKDSDSSVFENIEDAEQHCTVKKIEKLTKDKDSSENNNDSKMMDSETTGNISTDYSIPSNQMERSSDVESLDRINDNENSPPVTPKRIEPLSTVQRLTPKNHINYVQLVLAESIKKSHRKVKDENRKRIFKPASLFDKFAVEQIQNNGNRQELSDNDTENASTSQNDSDNNANRACTPENINSSRLLLSQFSSVKKSHKKDKHNKIVSGFIKRKKYLNKDLNGSQDGKDVHKLDTSCNSSQNDVSLNETNVSNETSKDNDSRDCIFDSHNKYESTPGDKLSPSKRKKLSDELFSNDPCMLEDPNSRVTMEKSAEEEFRIFTPIKKRKSLLSSLAKHTNKSNENKGITSEEPVRNNVSICTTPVICHNESLQSLEDDSFKRDTTESNENQNQVEECDLSMENPNGRSTPKNMSTSELFRQINSIKKSHKKDKRGYGTRRPLILSEEESYVTAESGEHSGKTSTASNTYLTATSNNETNLISQRQMNTKETIDNVDNSEPSTSKMDISTDHTVNEENQDIYLNTTPPNCLKMKTYIRLLQTASIKRSHKKVRDQKKNHLIPNSPELSDDGSIFGGEEKLNYSKEHKGTKDKKDEMELSVMNSTDELHRSISEENLSDDGSIFDASEKAEAMFNTSNEIGAIRRSSNMKTPIRYN